MVIIIYVSELFSLLRDRHMKYSTAQQSCSYAQQYLKIRVHIFIETKKLPLSVREVSTATKQSWSWSALGGGVSLEGDGAGVLVPWLRVVVVVVGGGGCYARWWTTWTKLTGRKSNWDKTFHTLDACICKLVWPIELHRDGKWVMQLRNHL